MTRKFLALLLKTIAAATVTAGASTALLAQAIPTATRAGDLQVGAGFALARSGYEPGVFKGATIYADFDFRRNLGVEGEFHQVYAPSGDQSYQRTYELGARYRRNYGALTPYAKALYGRGEYLYPYGLAEFSYNILGLGAGIDYTLRDHINLRAEYEYQKWFGFTGTGLTPQVITIGIAYRFAPPMCTSR